MPFHLPTIDDCRQQHPLTLRHKFVKQMASIHLVGQRVIGQNGMSLSKTGLQSGNNGKRQFLQLL